MLLVSPDFLFQFFAIQFDNLDLTNLIELGLSWFPLRYIKGQNLVRKNLLLITLLILDILTSKDLQTHILVQHNALELHLELLYPDIFLEVNSCTLAAIFGLQGREAGYIPVMHFSILITYTTSFMTAEHDHEPVSWPDGQVLPTVGDSAMMIISL